MEDRAGGVASGVRGQGGFREVLERREPARSPIRTEHQSAILIPIHGIRERAILGDLL